MKMRLVTWGLGLVAGLAAFALRPSDPLPPAPPTWVDSRPGLGGIFSLASGMAPTGEAIVVAGGYVYTDYSNHDLRIVCYDEADGRVRWESRFPRSIPSMSRVPYLEVDRSGDVLVGWGELYFEPFSATVIEKLSGRDGSSLWAWQTSGRGGKVRYQGIPKADPQGRVWATGIRQDAPDKFTRYLALLEQATGAAIWQQDFNAAKDGADRRLSITFLASGDAIVAVPPRGDGRGYSEPWLIQKIAASDGAAAWSVALPRTWGVEAPEVDYVLDEAGQQVIAFSYSGFLGPTDLRGTALALSDGAQRWARHYSRAELPDGGAEFLHGSKPGEIAGYTHHRWTSQRWFWRRWSKSGLIGWPERKLIDRQQAVSVHFSTADGAVLRQMPIGKGDESYSGVVRSPDGRQMACVLRSYMPRSDGRWRVVRGDAAATPWEPRPGKEIRGDDSQWRFPEVGIVTDSGRVVIAGNEKRKGIALWMLRVW